MTKIYKHCILAVIGGIIYILLELLFRGRTHFTMFFVGGLCFVAVGLINEIISWDTPLAIQMGIGGFLITLIEFVSGCVLNIGLGLEIWDYSDLPFNLLGQICPLFSLIWIFLSAVAIILDDYLRYWFFGEEKPHYTI